MNNYNITIQQRTENFAVRVIKAYSELNKRNFDDPGKILAKQFLRSGTSIGANCPKGYRFAYAEVIYPTFRRKKI